MQVVIIGYNYYCSIINDITYYYKQLKNVINITCFAIILNCLGKM